LDGKTIDPVRKNMTLQGDITISVPE